VWYTEPFDLRKLLRYNHVAVSAVFKKVDWEITGGFSPALRAGFEDWEFWIRLGEAGRRGHLIPEALLRQRRHGRTMTHTADAQRVRIVAEIRARHLDLLASYERSAVIQAAYVDRPVDRPLLNLARPTQYRRSETLGFLLLLPSVALGGAEAVAYELARESREHRRIECTIVTSVSTDNESLDRFDGLTRSVYHLPNFLLPNAWKPFVINLVETRGIDRLLIAASELGYSILPALKQRVPGIEVFNLLYPDSGPGYFRHSVQCDQYIKAHIATSSATATKLHDVGGIEVEKIRVINGGAAGGRARTEARSGTLAWRPRRRD
jgi:hypothetical protein